MDEMQLMALKPIPHPQFSWPGNRQSYLPIACDQAAFGEARAIQQVAACAVDACINSFACACAGMPMLLREHARSGEDCA